MATVTRLTIPEAAPLLHPDGGYVHCKGLEHNQAVHSCYSSSILIKHQSLKRNSFLIYLKIKFNAVLAQLMQSHQPVQSMPSEGDIVPGNAPCLPAPRHSKDFTSKLRPVNTGFGSDAFRQKSELTRGKKGLIKARVASLV